VTVGGEFPFRALSVARRVPSSTMAPWPSGLPFFTLQGSRDVVSRSSGFSPPHGYPVSQALSLQYSPWICHPLPPSRSGIAVTGAVFYDLFRPQGRRTSRGKTHSLPICRPASVHGGYCGRISGLAQPRLLAPLRTPIERVRYSLRTRVLPQASFRHPISGYALAVSWHSPSVRSRRVAGLPPSCLQQVCHARHTSDTPGKAGGLMSGTASKAVGSCYPSQIALVRQPLPALEWRHGPVPAQNLRSTRRPRGPRSVRRQRCGPVQHIAGQSPWPFGL
jgi:hypothetical protein